MGINLYGKFVRRTTSCHPGPNQIRFERDVYVPNLEPLLDASERFRSSGPETIFGDLEIRPDGPKIVRNIFTQNSSTEVFAGTSLVLFYFHWQEDCPGAADIRQTMIVIVSFVKIMHP